MNDPYQGKKSITPHYVNLFQFGILTDKKNVIRNESKDDEKTYLNVNGRVVTNFYFITLHKK